jgi:peptidoglycan/LPS O-acetylase OafA/YrhL
MTADARRGMVAYSAAPSYDYVPALDGLRALSVGLVILSHIGFKHYLPGGFGVTAFFFISGFLITRQVLAEQQRRGQLALGAFYIRRLLRLYPALLVSVAVGGTLFVSFGGHFPAGQITAAVFYFTNYYERVSSYIGVPDGMYNPFGILWSLAVEEHYYLVYPGLVFLLGRRRLEFVVALCVIIAVVTLWRFHLAEACSVAVPRCVGDGFNDRILQSTDTRIDSILYGALLATLLGTRLAAPLLKILQSRAVFAAGLVLLCLSFVIRDPTFRDSARFTIQGIGLFLAGGSALFSARLGWLRGLLALRPLLLLGRWSYSLYLWHSFVLLCLVSALPGWVWRPALTDGRISLGWDLVGIPVVVVLSVAVAALSYKFVEMPMVALRRRFGSHAVRDGAPGQVVVTPATV